MLANRVGDRGGERETVESELTRAKLASVMEAGGLPAWGSPAGAVGTQGSSGQRASSYVLCVRVCVCTHTYAHVYAVYTCIYILHVYIHI